MAVLADEVGHPVYLAVGEEAALYTNGGEFPIGQVEHVAVPEQLLCAVTVQDGAAVHIAGYLKRNAAGNIGLN